MYEQIRRGQRSVGIFFDLWWCLGVPSPAGTDAGSWRTAVSLAKGKNEDMAPTTTAGASRWRAGVRATPSGGQC